jgi:hypothetical protein
MQIQLNNGGSGERVLWEMGEEEFVDDSRPRDAHRALLFPSRMRGYHHTAGYAIGSHRDLGAIVEAAPHLTFGTLLKLIGGQVQPRLNQRMIEQVIVFAARHQREPSHIGEHGPVAILPIAPQQ